MVSPERRHILRIMSVGDIRCRQTGRMSVDQQNFFVAVATVAGGLLALMFIALQVRTEAWDAMHRRVVAVGFLLELLIVMVVALLSLAPGKHLEIAAIMGAGIGLLTCAAQVMLFIHYRALLPGSATAYDRLQFFGIFVSGTVYLTLMLLALWHPTLIYGVPYVLVWLCFSGSTEIGALLMWPRRRYIS